MAEKILSRKIQLLSEKYFEKVVALRRQIHAHPELSWQEKNTAQLVAETLTQLGLQVQTNVAGTGVVGILLGKNPAKKCVALRADMDALPILENSEAAYCSTIKGVMHACGHDVHTANLLGAAMILAELKNEIEGTYKFIFQPSEEQIPSGAEAMIKAGVLQNPTVEKMIGLHVTPEMESGTFGFCAGKFMASSDEIYLTINGKGGHAARVEELKNPLLIAAEILMELRQLTDIQKPVVLSFGKIEGKGATNIVPDKVEIAGTLRCFDEQLRAFTQKQIQFICQTICEKYITTCDVHIVKGSPVLLNDVSLTQFAYSLTDEYFGAGAAVSVPVRMGSEDFAYYTHHIPSLFYRLGTGNKKRGITSGLHTPTFDIDENSLKQSPGLMAWLAVNV